MNPVARLRRDHQMLRSKLDVIESALGMGPETWYVLREVCFTLARQLLDHMRREEELIMACRKTVTPAMLAEVALAHHDEPAHIRAINRAFVSAEGHSLERIKPQLIAVIHGLRRHMAEEEAQMFPVFEDVLGAPVKTPAPTKKRPAHPIDENMTVNRLVQEFPVTRRVFEQLFINVSLEGCTCLDEVAWRHGMDARDLLELLREAIASCACATAPDGAAKPGTRVATEAGALVGAA